MSIDTDSVIIASMGGFENTLVLFLVSLFAGVLGSLLGLGGGMIVVPVLTLGFGLDIRHAFGASLIAVIATSSGAAVSYVRERLTNIRIAMFLELGTTLGAITGAFIAGLVETRLLFVLFGVLLMASAASMFRRHDQSSAYVPSDKAADFLKLHGSYPDEAAGCEIGYRVCHSGLSLLLMYIAGILSGLLGIGSGILKVPVMDLIMRLPLKVSTATSNFMIGVTAAASAGVYFFRGDVIPQVAGPVAIGVMIGATLGARLMGRFPERQLRVIFVVVLIVAAIQMIMKGV